MPTIKKPASIKKAKPLVKKRKVSEVKAEKKPGTMKVVQPVVGEKVASSRVSIPVLSPTGEKTGTVSLPGELFGVKYNPQLVAQAVRVYEMNQREGSAATKTRGMVEGSTRKIYRQKGTGRARHGGIRAPIFVGGGIIFGPQPRDSHKTLPKTMKKKALASILSLVVEKGGMKVVDGIAELPVKTKSFAKMLTNIQVSKRILFVYGNGTKTFVRAARNIAQLTAVPFNSLHVYDVLTHAYIVFTKDALNEYIAKQK